MYSIGDQFESKKNHPCGEKKWEIIRTGADVKLKCLGCDRVIIVPRRDIEKKFKKI